MYHGEELDIWDIEKWSTSESAWEGNESRGEMSYYRSRNNETYRCSESKRIMSITLFFSWKSEFTIIDATERETGIWWIATHESMLSPRVLSIANHARMLSPSKSVWMKIAIQATDNDMIVVFMRIFMWLCSWWLMIVRVWREYFLEEID
jgi:hypothetical protein